MSVLYMVATPIGNLDDLTFRAVHTLQSVSLIACEDTRRSLVLFNRYSVHARLISCRSQNEAAAAQKVIAHLQSGADAAYVSDAGTPGISDPGARLCEAVRSAGFSVVPIPGASAVTALMSVAPLCGKGFTFVGFLSPKSGRRKTALNDYLQREEALIFYESPFRIVKLLSEIADIDSSRKVLFGRELTKKHETIIEGTAKELCDLFSAAESVKGECILLVNGQKKG